MEYAEVLAYIAVRDGEYTLLQDLLDNLNNEELDRYERHVEFLLDRIRQTQRNRQTKKLKPVCMIPDCGCTGEAHP